MPLRQIGYDRDKAVEYAHFWAYRRNPKFYDFSAIGGDCTNYASQCLYAGCEIMNFTPTYGWFYRSVNDRAPSWTSVVYFHRFIISNEGVGPFGRDVSIDEVEVGDFVQIRFIGKEVFGHTPIIVGIEEGERTTDKIYIAAHSADCDCRPLSTYKNVMEFRYIHIDGARYEE